MSCAFDRARTLFYSDDPEKLSVEAQGSPHGVLFDFDLEAGVRSRFLYYHVNADGPDRHVAVRVKNIAEADATLRFCSLLATPGTDYTAVGYASSARFTSKLMHNAWQSTTVSRGGDADRPASMIAAMLA